LSNKPINIDISTLRRKTPATQGYNLIEKWVPYYRSAVKHTLAPAVVGDKQVPFFEVIKRVIDSYAKGSLAGGLSGLCDLRELVFPELVDPPFAPEQFHPRFADFMLDENMWEQIGRRKLSSEGIMFIVDDLSDMYYLNQIFAGTNGKTESHS